MEHPVLNLGQNSLSLHKFVKSTGIFHGFSGVMSNKSATSLSVIEINTHTSQTPDGKKHVLLSAS